MAALKPVREALTPAWAYSCGSYMDETYIIDINRSLPGDWQELRGQRSTANNPVPAGQESFVKRFDGTEEGLLHLEKSRCTSRVTSPHVRGKSNYLLHEADHTHPTLAVWSGNESLGISDLAVERSALFLYLHVRDSGKPQPWHHHRHCSTGEHPAAANLPGEFQAPFVTPEWRRKAPPDSSCTLMPRQGAA